MAKVPVTIRVEENFRDKIFAEAKRQDLSVSTLVKLILQDYFKLK
jgi:predicted HicB family RNase H-like nuclease